MDRIRTTAALAAGLALAACNGKDGPVHTPGSNAPPSLVPVSTIVNALKCELAETFAGHDYVRDLIADKVEASLTLTDVAANKTAGEAGLEVEVGAIKFGPTGSRSRQVTATNAVKIGFDYAVADRRPAPAFCARFSDQAPVRTPSPRVVLVKGDPFVAILDGMQAEYAKVQAGDPKVKFGPLEYTIGFDIEKEDEFGAEVNVIVFKVGATQTETRTASQELSLTFNLEKLPRLAPPPG